MSVHQESMSRKNRCGSMKRGWIKMKYCHECKSKNIKSEQMNETTMKYVCLDCGYEFEDEGYF